MTNVIQQFLRLIRSPFYNIPLCHLISISEALETPVSILLGETITEPKLDDLKTISERLEVINLQLAQRKVLRRKTLHWLFLILFVGIAIVSAVLMALGEPYLSWNFNDPETAVIGTFFHAFEWLFARLAPILLIGAVIGAVLTRKEA